MTTLERIEKMLKTERDTIKRAKDSVTYDNHVNTANVRADCLEEVLKVWDKNE